MPKKKPNLGNTQCGTCLNIFPVYGELPQDVNCPRCGTEMKLEWRTEPEPEVNGESATYERRDEQKYRMSTDVNQTA